MLTNFGPADRVVMKNSVHLKKKNEYASPETVMRISKGTKRFLKLGLLSIVAAAGYWICSTPVETAERRLTPAERPPMFVLQVGIGKYVSAAELRGSVTDVVEMRKVLEGERYGIDPKNVVTLTDAQGTKPLIFKEFQTHLIANARAHFERTGNRDAVVLFQFSGHGSQVPDRDGDEMDDGKDETLVTHNSKDIEGKNFDITDDEIFALTSELRRWTDNIVYIFDSCHSGSGTRNSDDVRRVIARKTVPVAIPGVGTATRSGEVKAQDIGTGVLPPGDDYIVITAARANELASQKQCFEECGDAKKPVVYGNLTFYLIDELKNARADTSYRELMENVTRRVNTEKSTQTPQIEGDKARFVFSSLGRTEDNFVRITTAETRAANGARSVKIRAGAMQGLTAGTIVSFYDKAVTKFDGAEKIASGTILAVEPLESTVQLVNPKREITVGDKSVVGAPDLGMLRLKVDLDVDAAKFTAREKAVVELARRNLTPARPQEKREVELVTTRAGQPARWEVALLKDKFSDVVSKIPGAKAESFLCASPTEADKKTKGPAGKPDRDVLYFAGQDYVPLFDFCMETAFADENASARMIEERLVHLAGLKSVNSISNKNSALKGKVTVKPIRLEQPFDCVNSIFKPGAYKPSIADASGSHPFVPGDVVWFEVTNTSAVPLYATLLNMKPDGAVELFTPRDRADEAEGVIVPAGGKRILMSEACRRERGEWLEAGPFKVSGPSGLDRFKFIFSAERTTRGDFSYLEMPSFAKRNSGGRASLSSMRDWTTVDTVFQVNDKRN